MESLATAHLAAANGIFPVNKIRRCEGEHMERGGGLKELGNLRNVSSPPNANLCSAAANIWGRRMGSMQEGRFVPRISSFCWERWISRVAGEVEGRTAPPPVPIPYLGQGSPVFPRFSRWGKDGPS